MKIYKGESMKKYEKVRRKRTRCHGRWMYCARQEKREGGYSVPDEINAWIIFV